MYLKYRGLKFGGRSGNLIVTDFKAPTLEIKNSYRDRVSRDGQMVSRDTLTKATWQFSISTNGANLQDALDAAASLQSKWQDKNMRESSYASVLEYSHDGETWWKIYGRPGRFTSLEPDVHAQLGVGKIEMEFVQTDPQTYSSSETLTVINAVQAVQGGITAPILAPITTVHVGGERVGRITNRGNIGAPLVVTFYGPSTNPTIRNDDGFELTYNGTLAYDQYVRIDPLKHEVRLITGTQTVGSMVPGRLSRRTRLSDLVVQPGDSEWYYTALDDTGTSRVELSSRDAYNTFK